MIFLFLRNLSATVIPSLALPLSIVGTFAVMYLLGYSLDNLSLMALTLSVGFVVDDAIVMLENIVRHMEMGEAPLRGGARRARKEIGFTILSMTISLAAVFIPVLFMGGIIGRLFHEFAVTIGVAILVSGFVSLSLTPMLCSRFLKAARRRRRSTGASTSGRERGLRRDARALRADARAGAARTRGKVLAMSAAVLAATGLAVRRRSPRASSRPRTRARSSGSPKAPQGIWLRGDGGAPAGSSRRSSARIPTSDLHLELRPARQRQRRQHRDRASRS